MPKTVSLGKVAGECDSLFKIKQRAESQEFLSSVLIFCHCLTLITPLLNMCIAIAPGDPRLGHHCARRGT